MFFTGASMIAAVTSILAGGVLPCCWTPLTCPCPPLSPLVSA